MYEQTTQQPSAGSLHPLQNEGRHRDDDVTEQIQALQRCSPMELWRRVKTTDRNAPGFVKEEALVYLLRDRFRSGDMQAAGDIAEQLVTRSTAFIHRHVAAWKSLSPQHAEDCIYDILSQLWQDMFNLAQSCEFWEIRYWLCLKRRILNCIQKYRTMDESEVLPRPLEDQEGNEADFFEAQQARPALTPQHRIEIREALALLPEKERMVFVLFHYEEWTQQEIASRLHTTDRTVRNILGRAEERLAVWRAGNHG